MNKEYGSGTSRIKRMLLLALMATATVPAALQAQDSAERQFNAISRLIEKADLDLEAGRKQDATRLYGATIAAYRDFAEHFPDYQAELVQFRVSYCRQQLMGLLAQKRAEERTATGIPIETDVGNLVQRGAELCRSGRFAEAQAVMAPLVDNPPDAPLAALVLATARLGSGDIDGTRQQLERVLELDAENGIAHYNLAQVLLRTPAPDYPASREHYLQARRLGIPADSDLESVLDL